MRVLTIGTFDLFHYGHLRLLERAADFGLLTVGVNSDCFVREYKGKLPVFSEVRRQRIVGALSCVQTAVINDGPGDHLIRVAGPDLLVVGSDWHRKDYLAQVGITQEELDGLGISVTYLSRTLGVSTTELRA